MYEFDYASIGGTVSKSSYLDEWVNTWIKSDFNISNISSC